MVICKRHDFSGSPNGYAAIPAPECKRCLRAQAGFAAREVENLLQSGGYAVIMRWGAGHGQCYLAGFHRTWEAALRAGENRLSQAPKPKRGAKPSVLIAHVERVLS